MDSILTSIKKLLGITTEYKQFDPDLIIHINSVFLILKQLGIGPEQGFSISGEYETWKQFLPEGSTNLEAVKSYMHIKVKLLFDPPTSSAVMEAMNRMASEYEWRLNVEAESIPVIVGEDGDQNE
mgnify:CR=1 FL=1